MTADVDKSSLTDGQIIDLANAAFRDCEGGSLARMDNDLYYLRTVRAALRSAQVPEVNPLREYAKRNLRKLIELGSTDKALMLLNLEEL